MVTRSQLLADRSASCYDIGAYKAASISGSSLHAWACVGLGQGSAEQLETMLSIASRPRILTLNWSFAWPRMTARLFTTLLKFESYTSRVGFLSRAVIVASESRVSVVATVFSPGDGEPALHRLTETVALPDHHSITRRYRYHD
jgi:hypothetical protein